MPNSEPVTGTPVSEIHDVEVLRIIERAFARALTSKNRRALPIGRLNAERSQSWVTALRDEFLQAYRSKCMQDVRAFCKECADNRKEFGLNELLHDVCVCRVAAVESRRQRKNVMFVAEALWQIESEFKNSGTDTMKDFNKLILGSAKQKLFIGPLTTACHADLEFLKGAAEGCSGQVYVAFLSHPDRWMRSADSVVLYRFDRRCNTWISIIDKRPHDASNLSSGK